MKTCGTCRECCIFLTIRADGPDTENIKKYITIGEDKKGKGTPCPQLNPNLMKFGCTIYQKEDKPNLCREYKCLYLSGELGEDQKLRPDNLGVIFDITKESMLRFIETKPNALNGKLAQKVQKDLLDMAYESEEDWQVQITKHGSSVAFQGNVKSLKSDTTKINK